MPADTRRFEVVDMLVPDDATPGMLIKVRAQSVYAGCAAIVHPMGAIFSAAEPGVPSLEYR